MRCIKPDFGVFVMVALAMALNGCAATSDSSEKPASTVKPMDRVREGIVAVSADLKRTMEASQALAEGGRSARSRFSQDLKSTEQQIATLRNDAAELRERASEYLSAWSGQTYIVTNATMARGTDSRREGVKTTYDEFVSELVSAKEIVLPLLDRWKAIEGRADRAVTTAELQQAQADGTRVVQHLEDGLKKLDELKKQLQTRRD
jgi:hypothetical protein